MTLDEAIKHAEEVAESKEKQVKNGDWEKDSLTERNCIKCAGEHRQLAEWLKDYKRLLEQEPCDDATLRDIFCMGCEYKEQEPIGDLISRQEAIKAIDEKAKRIKNEDTLYGLAGAVGILFDLPSVKPQPICEEREKGECPYYAG